MLNPEKSFTAVASAAPVATRALGSEEIIAAWDKLVAKIGRIEEAVHKGERILDKQHFTELLNQANQLSKESLSILIQCMKITEHARAQILFFKIVKIADFLCRTCINYESFQAMQQTTLDSLFLKNLWNDALKMIELPLNMTHASTADTPKMLSVDDIDVLRESILSLYETVLNRVWDTTGWRAILDKFTLELKSPAGQSVVGKEGDIDAPLGIFVTDIEALYLKQPLRNLLTRKEFTNLQSTLLAEKVRALIDVVNFLIVEYQKSIHLQGHPLDALKRAKWIQMLWSDLLDMEEQALLPKVTPAFSDQLVSVIHNSGVTQSWPSIAYKDKLDAVIPPEEIGKAAFVPTATTFDDYLKVLATFHRRKLGNIECATSAIGRGLKLIKAYLEGTILEGETNDPLQKIKIKYQHLGCMLNLFKAELVKMQDADMAVSAAMGQPKPANFLQAEAAELNHLWDLSAVRYFDDVVRLYREIIPNMSNRDADFCTLLFQPLPYTVLTSGQMFARAPTVYLRNRLLKKYQSATAIKADSGKSHSHLVADRMLNFFDNLTAARTAAWQLHEREQQDEKDQQQDLSVFPRKTWYEMKKIIDDDLKTLREIHGSDDSIGKKFAAMIFSRKEPFDQAIENTIATLKALQEKIKKEKDDELDMLMKGVETCISAYQDKNLVKFSEVRDESTGRVIKQQTDYSSLALQVPALVKQYVALNFQVCAYLDGKVELELIDEAFVYNFYQSGVIWLHDMLAKALEEFLKPNTSREYQAYIENIRTLMEVLEKGLRAANERLNTKIFKKLSETLVILKLKRQVQKAQQQLQDLIESAFGSSAEVALSISGDMLQLTTVAMGAGLLGLAAAVRAVRQGVSMQRRVVQRRIAGGALYSEQAPTTKFSSTVGPEATVSSTAASQFGPRKQWKKPG